MAIQKRFDLLDRGGLGIASVATTSSAFSVGRGVVEAGVDDLLGVGVVLAELLHRPADGNLLGEAAFCETIAHPHDILVMASTLKHDVGFRQLGRDEGVEVGLDALHLLVLLALLGIRGCGGGDFLGGERNNFGLRAKEHFGVVGETAQPCQVLALHVRLAAEQLLVVGVATEERRLIISDCVPFKFSGLNIIVRGIYTELRRKLILEDDA